MFINPTEVERITSKFRTSDRPNHHGVDIAEKGDHEIYAVADGVVTRSYTSPSYGECIFILHNINGQEWESVYAHMRTGSRTVRVEARVKQGQVIGVMGNTGDSNGQHLHFELHKGRWNAKKSNAVNPLDYIGKTPAKEVEYKGNSIVDYLNLKGIDSSANNRRKLAKEYGVSNYDLSAAKNIELLNKMRGGKPKPKVKQLHLPASASSWRVYPTNKAPVKGNEKGFLNPKKFGGLVYDVIGEPQKDVVTIKTADFGVVNIYVAPSTGAVIK